MHKSDPLLMIAGMPMKIRASIVSLLALACLGGCTEFVTFARNECGNRVLDVGEYCDGSGQMDGTCIPAGQPGACHYQCDYFTDGLMPDAIKKCPEGQGCGVDGVCRGAGGDFEEPISYVGDGILGFGAGDFDGNGRTDLVTYSLSRTDIHHFDEVGNEVFTFSVPGFPDQPVIGLLDQSSGNEPLTSDLILKTGETVSVFLGQSDGTLKPKLFSTQIAENAETLHLAVPFRLDANRSEKDIAVLAGPAGNIDTPTHLKVLDIGKPPGPNGAESLIKLELDGTKLIGRVAIGLLSPKDKCDAMGFMTAGNSDPMNAVAPMLQVYQGCTLMVTGNGPVYPPKLDMGFTVEIPDGRVPWLGVWFADMDGDDHPDILYGTDDEATGKDKRIDIIRINSDLDWGALPSFTSEPLFTVGSLTQADLKNLSTDKPEYACGGPPGPMAPPLQLANTPLAFGDLNGDKKADIIDTLGVVFTTPILARPYARYDCQKQSLLTVATIGNFNMPLGAPNLSANDAFVASEDVQGLIFYNGDGAGAFTPIFIPTDNYVHQMISGDYDGDQIMDLVVREKDRKITNDQSSETGSHLSILYGNVAGPPELPESLGDIENVLDVRAGAVRGRDSASDLLVLTGMVGEARNGYLFFGRPDRLFVSPQLLLTNYGDTVYSGDPRQLALGRFIGEDAMDIMVIASQMGPGEERPWILKDAGSDSVNLEASPTLLSAILSKDMPDMMPAVDSIDYFFGLQLNGNESPDNKTEIVGYGASGGAYKLITASFNSVEAGSGLANISISASPPLKGSKLGAEFATAKTQQPYAMQMRPVDVNSDGLEDIVGLLDDSTAVVIWNTGTGTIDIENFSKFNLTGESKEIKDIAFVNLDTDADKELVLVTKAGVMWADLVPAADIANFVKANFEERDLLIERLNAERAVGGDFNGDGVDDLAIGGEGGFSLLLGSVFVPTHLSDDTKN